MKEFDQQRPPKRIEDELEKDLEEEIFAPGKKKEKLVQRRRGQ
jgi:hypothetical protein